MHHLNAHIANWLQGADPFSRFAQAESLGGEVFRQKEGRCTYRCEIDGRGYFVKFHAGIGWREIFKNLLQLRLPVTGARNEWRAAQRLQQLGIGTLQVAAYGQRGWNPARQKSFIVSEKIVNVVCLEDYTQDWGRLPPSFAHKHRLLRQVAELSGRMHSGGVCHRDFYLCHILLHKGEPGQPPLLSVIDLHRALCRRSGRSGRGGRGGCKLRRRWLVKDLGGLYYSAQHIGLTRHDILRFIRYYERAPLRQCLPRRGSFWRKVQHRQHRLARKLSQ